MAFKHVLVPTDLSEPGNRAVRYALEEASLHQARVTLLHVLSSSARTDVYYVTGAPITGPHPGFDPLAGGRVGAPLPSRPTVVRDDDGEAALTELRDLAAGAPAGLVAVEVAVGPPAETIVRVAGELAADLVVMSTHGRTGLQHVLLGSVAEKVVRLAPCAVLTVKYRRD
jgi:nucleotide-binding universal stress UspA family protein